MFLRQCLEGVYHTAARVTRVTVEPGCAGVIASVLSKQAILTLLPPAWCCVPLSPSSGHSLHTHNG